MKNWQLITFILLISTLSKARVSSPSNTIKMKINSTFIRNKKVWGTYKQISESITGQNKKKSSINPIGDMIIQGGKLHLIGPQTMGDLTQIKTINMEYHKTRKKTYSAIAPKKLESFYKIKVQNFIKKYLPKHENNFVLNEESFGKLICNKLPGKLNCFLDINLQIK